MSAKAQGEDASPRPVGKRPPGPESIGGLSGMGEGLSAGGPGVTVESPRPTSYDGKFNGDLPRPPFTSDQIQSSALTLYGEVEPARIPGFVRKPFGDIEQKLAWPVRFGYHRHWFNDPQDKPGRIDQAYLAGYVHVRDNSGKAISRIVGRGGLRAYLMECPTEFWEADQAALERRNRKVDHAIKGGTLDLKPGEEKTRYVPKEGIDFRDE